MRLQSSVEIEISVAITIILCGQRSPFPCHHLDIHVYEYIVIYRGLQQEANNAITIEELLAKSTRRKPPKYRTDSVIRPLQVNHVSGHTT